MNKKFMSQKITNNKIYIVSADLYHKTFLYLDWLETLTQYKKICLKILDKIFSQFNDWIRMYIRWSKIR